MRLIALLLTVMMMTGTTAQVCASPDASGIGPVEVMDAPDVWTPRLAEPMAAARPDHRPQAQIEAPVALPGRLHAIVIFRPPRVAA